MLKVLSFFLALSFTGCSIVPYKRIGIDVPVAAIKSLQGEQVTPMDLQIPPIKAYYDKNMYEEDLVVSVSKKPDGSYSITIRSVTEADKSLELVETILGSAAGTAAMSTISNP